MVAELVEVLSTKKAQKKTIKILKKAFNLFVFLKLKLKPKNQKKPQKNNLQKPT